MWEIKLYKAVTNTKKGADVTLLPTTAQGLRTSCSVSWILEALREKGFPHTKVIVIAFILSLLDWKIHPRQTNRQ